MNYHKTVMLDETLNLLNIKSGGIYVDATLGGGGLSGEILKKLDNNGRLIAIDIDKDAIDYCKEKFKNEKKIQIFNCNFTEISEVLKELKINKVDGICVDLGVSSHQIDCAERGFSYIHDAPLDMRMGQSGAAPVPVDGRRPGEEGTHRLRRRHQHRPGCFPHRA